MTHYELPVTERNWEPALNEDYWDCECEKFYIHKKVRSPAIMINCGACGACGAVEVDQPDSHANEVGKPQNMAVNRGS